MYTTICNRGFLLTGLASALTNREVLLHFYQTTNEDSWAHRNGWATNEDQLGSWFGVTVNGVGDVVKLELQGKMVFWYGSARRREGNNVSGKS